MYLYIGKARSVDWSPRSPRIRSCRCTFHRTHCTGLPCCQRCCLQRPVPAFGLFLSSCALKGPAPRDRVGALSAHHCRLHGALHPSSFPESIGLMTQQFVPERCPEAMGPCDRPCRQQGDLSIGNVAKSTGETCPRGYDICQECECVKMPNPQVIVQ